MDKAGFPKGDRTPQADSNVTRTQQGNVGDPVVDQQFKHPNEGGVSNPIRGQSSSGLGMGPKWADATLRDTTEVPPPGAGPTSNLGKWPSRNHEKPLG